MAATALMDDIDIANEVELDGLDDELYEVVDGQRIEKPPMSAYSVRIGSRLFRKLGTFADDGGLGETVGEMLFRLPLPGEIHRNRRPDVAYVSFARWPSDRPMPPKENAWDVVPDLAVEVISPSDFAAASLHKVLEYFHAGVGLVWVVYPEERQVYVYDSPTQIRILTPNDTLDGGTVLPGFRLRLDRLFDPIAPTGEGT
jgi:Uma2 family endonuclease